MAIVYGGDAEIAKWVKARIPEICRWREPRSLGVTRGGVLVAGVVYYNWHPPDIHLAMAADSPRWATKQNVFTLLAYPFLQIGVGRVTLTIARSNKRSRRLAEGVGFKLEGKLRKYLPNGEDMMMYGYLREEFLASKWASDGQRHTRSGLHQPATAA